MGSGSSKPKPVPQKSTPKSPDKTTSAVTNVNIQEKSPVKNVDSEKQSETSVTTNSKSQDKKNESPKKSKKSKNSNWGSDSELEDDLDKFIQDTVNDAALANSGGRHTEEPPRPRTSHGRANSRPENAYPETYAQKHTREQYTVDRDVLIRQKTIYRNPDEWNIDSDDDDEDNQGGFDASKFRKVNTHQEENPVSATQNEFETPRYIKSQDERKMSTYGIYEKERTPVNYERRISKVPTYDLDEQRLLAELENEF